MLGAADGLGLGGGAGLGVGRGQTASGRMEWAADGGADEKGRVRAESGLAWGGGVGRVVSSAGRVWRHGKAAAMHSRAAHAMQNDCSFIPAQKIDNPYLRKRKQQQCVQQMDLPEYSTFEILRCQIRCLYYLLGGLGMDQWDGCCRRKIDS